MSIKNWCLGLAMAMTVAAEAGATTIVNYDLWLRYEGTAFTNASYVENGDEGALIAKGDFAADNMLPGMKSLLHGDLKIGDTIHFVMKIVHPDVPDLDDLYYGNGGRTPVCQMGSWDCTSTNFTSEDGSGGVPGDEFVIAYDDIWSVSGSRSLGSNLTTRFWTGLTQLPVQSTDGRFSWWYDDETASFTVVEAPAVAPVPLPAPALLLPLGIGALAAMRKRRRRIG